MLDESASLKRIAWAFGCSKKGSEEERQLEALLRRKVAHTPASTPPLELDDESPDWDKDLPDA